MQTSWVWKRKGKWINRGGSSRIYPDLVCKWDETEKIGFSEISNATFASVDFVTTDESNFIKSMLSLIDDIFYFLLSNIAN